MKLSDFDLEQLDEARLSTLTDEQRRQLLSKALADLKEARERLKADSRTSSQPPSRDLPWGSCQGWPTGDEELSEAERRRRWLEQYDQAKEQAEGQEREKAEEQEHGPAAKPRSPAGSKRPGRRKGQPGHGRSQKLEITATLEHRPETCTLCGARLAGQPFQAHTGFYVLDLEQMPAAGEGLVGLHIRHDKHLYGECVCSCGHRSLSQPGRCPREPMWEVALSQWHLIGPRLASLIVCLAHRLRLSRRKIQEFLHDWLGVELSTATISQCLHEAGRAVEPLEEALVDDLRQAALVHADETPWKEAGQLLWLWVFSCSTVCLYFICYRSKEILTHLFEGGLQGWLMSDGFSSYRHLPHRLRCWAHLLRKARGLENSFSPTARQFAQRTLELMQEAMAAIYAAREGPPGQDLSGAFEQRLEAFRALCEQHRHARHEKTAALAKEFLNDWEAIWQVLAHPQLPLTNNEAEGLLRHWVIARAISHGTRTEQGSRALGLLASVIETCRKRQVSPWPYLAEVIAQRRQGHPAPPLPVAATLA